jgi:hypothetical protein
MKLFKERKEKREAEKLKKREHEEWQKTPHKAIVTYVIAYIDFYSVPTPNVIADFYDCKPCDLLTTIEKEIMNEIGAKYVHILHIHFLSESEV